jgi:hypothetical protein
MARKKNGHFVKCFVFCWLFSLSLPALAQQPSPQQQDGAATSSLPHPYKLNLQKGPPLGLSDQVGALRVEGVLPFEALQRVSRKYNVVVGIEAVTYKSDQKISLDFPGGTLADLLGAFVTQAPDYHWQNDNGIIHVFRNGASISLANVMLNYPGASQQERYLIWLGLRRLPEHVGWMKTYQCQPFARMSAFDFKFNDGPIDIPAGAVTVAQLLDQVAKKSGDGFWAILQSDPSDPVCRISVIDWSW